MGARQVVFLTRSTTPDALLNFEFNTSSQAYEVNLVRALCEFVELTVVNIGRQADHSCGSPPVTMRCGIRDIRYIAFGQIGGTRLLEFTKLLRALANRIDTAVITSGYYLNEMACLASVRSASIKTYSIVFDTHVQGNSAMRAPKRWLANLYFELGFHLLRRLTGMIVVNDAFIRTKRMHIKYHKTKIGKLFTGSGAPAISPPRPGEEVRLFFAGTLNADNGVRLILDYLEQYRDHKKVSVCFFGYGALLSEVKLRAASDPRVQYGGVLTDPQLDVSMLEYDYLLCLRDPGSVTSAYAFPSKLIKFMGSGVPVISNVFTGLDASLQQHLLLLNDYSVAAFARMVDALMTGADHRAVGVRSRDFIEQNHSWHTISSRMIGFLFAPGCAVAGSSI